MYIWKVTWECKNCPPNVSYKGQLEIGNGRHPVVKRGLEGLKPVLNFENQLRLIGLP